MIRCAIPRGSKAVCRLKVTRRPNFMTSSNILSNSNESNHSQHPSQEPASFSTPIHNGAPVEIDPSTRLTLPISPLMDPSFLLAREKRLSPKLHPSKQTQTPFQQQLAKNPYALALATPIRSCSVTNEALPRFFLEDYRLLAHPETGLAYWMPTSLTRKYGKGQEQEVKDGVGEILGEGEEAMMNEEAVVGTAQEGNDGKDNKSVDRQSSGRETSPHLRKDYSPSIGPSAYTLSRKDVLHVMQNRKSGFGADPHTRLGPPRMKDNRATRQLQARSQWRPDMEEFVLELMRRRTTELLIKVLELKRGYVVGCKSWEDALSKGQAGAFLWTGNMLGESGDEVENPSEFATLFVGSEKRRKAPVHNLRRLLGKEKLAELDSRFRNGIFENNVLVIKHKNMTVDLQMRLWKLQGYLAEHREESGADVQ